MSCGYEFAHLQEEDELEDNPDDPDDIQDLGNPEGADDPNGPRIPQDDVPNEQEDIDDETANFGFDDPFMDVIIQLVGNITVREVFALVLVLSVRYSTTYDCTVDIFKTLNIILGRKYFPESKDKLWSRLGRNKAGIKEYFFCPRCLKEIENYNQQPQHFRCACRCRIDKKKNVGVFLSLNMLKQVRNLLQKQGFAQLLQYRERREKNNPDNIEDLLDGSFYQSLQEPGKILSNNNNYSMVLNTDGMKVTKRSNVEAWPAFARLVEIPPLIRQKNIILCGVWVNKKHPNMNYFLRPLVEQCNRLSSVGVNWTLNGEAKRSLIAPICCTADAKGRCAMLNLTEPTGYYACQFCDYRGVNAGGSRKFPVWPHPDYPHLQEPRPRSHESIVQNMIQRTHGFKGASQLALLDHFDLKKSFSTDDLHPIYLGVMKDYLEEMFDATNQCYIGDPQTIIDINRRFQALKTPTNISRKPRPIETWKKWTGTELRNLLLYQLPCLKGILPNRFLNHLKHLADAVFLLSQESISEDDLVRAEERLQEFVIEYEDLFGVEKMKFNIHMLLHLVEVVRILGNLFAHSTCDFESWNARIKDYVTSSNAVHDQIINRHLLNSLVSTVQYDERLSDRVREFVISILSHSVLDNAFRVGDVYFLGKSEQRPVTAQERRELEVHRLQVNYVTEYKRAYHKNREFRSAAYVREGRSDNTNIFTWDGMFAHIESIFVFRTEQGEDVCGMLCKVYDYVQPDPIASHTFKILPSDRPYDWVTFTDVRSLVVKIDNPNNESFLVRIANHIDID